MEMRGAADVEEGVWLDRRKGRGGGTEVRGAVDTGKGEGCAWAAHGAAPTQETSKTIMRINGQADLSIMQTPLHSGSSVGGQDRPLRPKGKLY